ncbi:MAG TPA: OsmC family protein [Bacteroidales bacterium]|jgi:putative redox protein|nr:OsmC family protein [Bacteroidales bacterium]
MTDKSKELRSTIKLINDKLLFKGTVGDNTPISIDYIAPLGDDMGYTSLELLLLSLSSCLGSAMLTFLRRMHRAITGFEMHARGLRKEEHPTGFSRIFLDIHITSPDATEQEVKKVISMAEEKYCPVWSMIKGNTTVETAFTVNN